MEQQQFSAIKQKLNFLTLSQLNEVYQLVQNATRQEVTVRLSEEERQFIHRLFAEERTASSYS
ncbi:hypothetical protein M445_07705 [Vibrio owensii 47666-1]|nr:hypothetical protein M445_07705 [Vibrio owensii 47666-1]